MVSSCATLANKTTTLVNIEVDTDSVKVCVNNDTTHWHNTPVTIKTLRQEKELQITAKKQNDTKQYFISSRLSPSFIYGNIFSGGVAAYMIDLTNPKRFYYPSNITLYYNSAKYKATNSYTTNSGPEKNLINLKFSIPEGNHFFLNKGSAYGRRFGFLGISGGAEYYFSDKYCVSFDVGGMLDFMIPIPVPVDYWGGHESVVAEYGDIQIGRDFNRFHFDGGFQFHQTTYRQWGNIEHDPSLPDYDPFTLTKYVIRNNAGLAFSSYYRINNTFQLGLNYYPSYVNWYRKDIDLHYSHILFFELSFKFEAFRPKRFLIVKSAK